MSDEINKEILRELRSINEKLDRIEDPKEVPTSKFLINCILIFVAVLFATVLLFMLPVAFN